MFSEYRWLASCLSKFGDWCVMNLLPDAQTDTVWQYSWAVSSHVPPSISWFLYFEKCQAKVELRSMSSYTTQSCLLLAGLDSPTNVIWTPLLMFMTALFRREANFTEQSTFMWTRPLFIFNYCLILFVNGYRQ